MPEWVIRVYSAHQRRQDVPHQLQTHWFPSAGRSEAFQDQRSFIEHSLPQQPRQKGLPRRHARSCRPKTAKKKQKIRDSFQQGKECSSGLCYQNYLGRGGSIRAVKRKRKHRGGRMAQKPSQQDQLGRLLVKKKPGMETNQPLLLAQLHRPAQLTSGSEENQGGRGNYGGYGHSLLP